MDEQQVAHLTLAEKAVESFADEYKGLADQWDAIDRKAQGMVTVAGIFVAGLLAFVRDLATTGTCLQRVVLTISLSLLVVSVGLALISMHLRSVKPAPFGKPLKTLVDELLEGEAPNFDALKNFANDHAKVWVAANDSVLKTNLNKARWLEASQWSLVGGIVAAAIVTIIKTWGA